MAQILKKFLVVEDEPDLLEFIALFLTENFGNEILKTVHSEEALKILESEHANIQLIISDFQMPKVSGGQIFAKARELNPQIPFLLVTSDARDKHAQMLNTPNTSYVQKPFTEKMLVQGVKKLIDVGRMEAQSNYLAISIDCLLRIREMAHPLFVKINEDKFVKMVNAQTIFDLQEYERFRQKKIFNLYIERPVFKEFVQSYQNSIQTNMLFTSFRKAESAIIDLPKEVLAVVSETLKGFGWTSETESLIKKNIELVQNISQKTKEISQYFKNLQFENELDYATNHSILVACLSTAFCNEYPFENKNSSEILSLAAFFHDLALDSHLVRNEQRFIKALKLNSKQNKEEIAHIKEHPLHAVQLLSQWPLCPPEVIKIVKHHHESPDGTGFPDGLKALEFDPLLACFILCEEIVELMLQKKSLSLVSRHLVMQEKKFSQAPFEAFYQMALKWLPAPAPLSSSDSNAA